MTSVKRLVLDVLKPHHPNALEFAQGLAQLGTDYVVKVMVDEIDENTETLVVEIIGKHIDFELVQAQIEKLGASIHSIDEVEVQGEIDT